jgi:hypothetical protein
VGPLRNIICKADLAAHAEGNNIIGTKTILLDYFVLLEMRINFFRKLFALFTSVIRPLCRMLSHEKIPYYIQLNTLKKLAGIITK